MKFSAQLCTSKIGIDLLTDGIPRVTLIFPFRILALRVFVILIMPVLVFTQGMEPTSRTPGSPAGSYKLGDLDNVNLFNGNLSFALPLLSVLGRGETSQSHPSPWVGAPGARGSSPTSPVASTPRPPVNA